MNLNNKVKCYILEVSCYKIYVSAFGNVFGKVSLTEIKVTLIGFDGYISNNYIPIGSATTVFDSPKDAVISCLSDTPLLHGYTN